MGILVALITASISIVLALYSSWASFKSQTRLEKLRTELTSKLAKQTAELDYEYEARKNLYKECQPYIFQLIEASERALNHIKYLAKKGKRVEGMAFSDEYDVKTSVYNLLFPSAVFKVSATCVPRNNIKV